MKKISIIVPVYNAEKYLKKCLESIINQTYQNIEIIIVNDGSTDNSQKIIEEYSKKYPDKIKSYVKKNGGLSDARNYGVERATGEYIAFVDSDDYIDLNLLEILKEEIDKETELIKFKLIKVEKNEEKKVNGPIFKDKSGEEAFNLMVFKENLIEPACLYLYKKLLFKNNNFKFALNRYHEDFGLTPLIILKSKTVSSLDVYGYYYVQTDGSITRNNDYDKKIKRYKDLLYHYDNMLKNIENLEIGSRTKDNIRQYYTNSIIESYKNLKERKQFNQEIKERKLLKNIKTKNVKTIIKKFILKIKYSL